MFSKRYANARVTWRRDEAINEIEQTIAKQHFPTALSFNLIKQLSSSAWPRQLNQCLFPRLNREPESEQQPIKKARISRPVHHTVISSKRSLKRLELLNKDAKHVPEVLKQAKAFWLLRLPFWLHLAAVWSELHDATPPLTNWRVVEQQSAAITGVVVV